MFSSMSRLVAVFAALGLFPPVMEVSGQQVGLSQELLQRLLRNSKGVERVQPGRVGTTHPVNATVTLTPGMVLVPSVDTASPVQPAPDSMTEVDSHGQTHAHLFEFITLDANLRPRWLAVTAEPQGGGLRHDGEWFRGAVYLGIEDPDHPGEVVTFAPVALRVNSHADQTAPDRVYVHRTMIPTERITLEASSPGTNIPLYIWVDGQQGRIEYQVPVIRSRIRIEPTTRTPQGLGLDEVGVTVTVPEDVRADSVVVRLSAGGLQVPSLLTLRPGVPASFTIRTKGFGADTIHVAGPGFLEAGLTRVDIRFPFFFLLAALLGGLAGAIGSRFWRTRKHKAVLSTLTELGAGLAAGLVVAVIYTLGVNLTPLPITGPPVEAVVFAIAAAGSMFGLSALLKVGGGAA